MEITLYEKMKRGCRGSQAEHNSLYEGAFVEMLNQEMEELLKSIENNKELKKLYENNSIHSIGVENEKERN